MLETLLPFFYLFGVPVHQPMMREPMMTAPTQWEAPAVWEDPVPMLERMPVQQPKPDPVVEREIRKMNHERATQVRRKGYKLSHENYFKKRLSSAVNQSDPAFKELILSQRAHRGIVRTSRRIEREQRDFPRGCAFPCAE